MAAPHALGQADLDRLERFARERGGAVLLLLDRRPDGALTRLLPPLGAERQLAKAQAVGPLQITDAQTFVADNVGVKTLAALDAQPVIVSRALGRGHVVVSGALDAWRVRDDGRFAAFWSGLVSDAALAVGPDLAVEVEPSLAKPGERVRVTVRRRSGDAEPAGLAARAELRCGDETWPVRLWPEGRPGVFTATVVAARDGRARSTRASTTSTREPPRYSWPATRSRSVPKAQRWRRRWRRTAERLSGVVRKRSWRTRCIAPFRPRVRRDRRIRCDPCGGSSRSSHAWRANGGCGDAPAPARRENPFVTR